MSKLAKKLRKQQQKTAYKATNTTSLQLYNSGKMFEAGNASVEELKLNPHSPTALYVQGQLSNNQGQHQHAAELFIRAIAARPKFAEAHFALGCTYNELKLFKEAIPCFKKALNLGLEIPALFNVLANALQGTGEIDHAIGFYKKALQLAPDFYQAHFNLGNAYHARRQIQESLACFKKAISINNDYYLALDNLGTIYDDLGNYEEAILCYTRSIKINNFNPVSHNNLANVLRNSGLLEDAENSCLKALRLNENFAPAYKNLGTIYHEMGRESEAISSYRQSLDLAPNHNTHSNLLFSMNYLENISQKEIYSESLRWQELYAPETLPNGRNTYFKITKGRRVKIGYLSPDFCDHSVSYFIEPVIQFHNREHFKIYCYANVKKPDAITQRLKDSADQWHDIFGMADTALVELIRRDSIDILVDLAGHTRGNRLLVFAQNPAPVQITWLGYPNTTGMRAMHYRLTDALADPPGAWDNHYRETLIHLPQGFLCYQPDTSAPEVSPLPCLKKGHLTFGSFNNLSKVTDRVILLWAEILLSVPDSRLILKNKALADQKSMERYRAMFEEAGVSGNRLDLLGMLPNKADHLDLYRKVDIGLDPFPYAGTTTTCEALWMGVPVITLLGESHSGRVGASIMYHTGLEEFVAKSPEEYKTLAISLADEVNKLSELRSGLREKLHKSPLMDKQQFTEILEDVLKKLVLK